MTVDSRSSVGPLGYWAGCYRKYATFSGRARRAEYWWYTLFNAVIYLALIAIGFLLGNSDGGNVALGILVAVFILVVFLPTLAVTSRRLHDAGLSGWWQLLGIIPLGGFAVLIMTLLDSNDGPNKYGPEPL
ncbi:DUF805 domain-containing protein [Nucisporomicrobium flavum]|uniref:DUF805 domain-containing protein n=1 Tax=Nucisporomicrobium flavum TaxID=2785915 RepID=UPI0027DC122D|nr:DUF805 domain-containing protein [Nucisporomicrobium flavum]